LGDEAGFSIWFSCVVKNARQKKLPGINSKC